MNRMKLLGGLLIAVVLASPVTFRAAIVDEANRFPEVVSPGQKVTLSGTFDPAKTAIIAKLYPLGSKDANDAKDAKDAKVASANQAEITLPDNLPPGRYTLKLTYNGVTEQAPGELRVEANAVKVDGQVPKGFKS